MSKDLANFFVDPVVVQHPGGHYLAASAPQKTVYQEFFKTMLSQQKTNVT